MLREVLAGFGVFTVYYIIAALILLIVLALLKPPKELFRKLLHLTCAMSVIVLLHVFNTWYLAMLAAIAFPIFLYPLISFIERFPKIIGIFNQRKRGEIRSSLIISFFAIGMLIAIFWGWLGEQWKYIIIVSVMAWGFGDAAAALVGKAFGRNLIRHRWVEATKTREGAIAMYSVSAVVILLSLIIYTSLPLYLCLAGALLVAPICAVVELISHHGLDTITVPFATAIPIFSLMILFSFMGVY